MNASSGSPRAGGTASALESGQVAARQAAAAPSRAAGGPSSRPSEAPRPDFITTQNPLYDGMNGAAARASTARYFAMTNQAPGDSRRAAATGADAAQTYPVEAEARNLRALFLAEVPPLDLPDPYSNSHASGIPMMPPHGSPRRHRLVGRWGTQGSDTVSLAAFGLGGALPPPTPTASAPSAALPAGNQPAARTDSEAPRRREIAWRTLDRLAERRPSTSRGGAGGQQWLLPVEIHRVLTQPPRQDSGGQAARPDPDGSQLELQLEDIDTPGHRGLLQMLDHMQQFMGGRYEDGVVPSASAPVPSIVRRNADGLLRLGAHLASPLSDASGMERDRMLVAAVQPFRVASASAAAGEQPGAGGAPRPPEQDADRDAEAGAAAQPARPQSDLQINIIRVLPEDANCTPQVTTMHMEVDAGTPDGRSPRDLADRLRDAPWPGNAVLGDDPRLADAPVPNWSAGYPRSRAHRPRRDWLATSALQSLQREVRGRGAAAADGGRQRSRERSRPAAAPAEQERSEAPRRGLSSCMFLQAGMSFEGVQAFMDVYMHQIPKAWKVTVEISQVNHALGTLCGTMTAKNIPNQDGPITTFWYGEIVDMRTTLFASPHFATPVELDYMRWQRFPAFARLGCTSPSSMGAISRECVQQSGSIFMRWKEQSFLPQQPAREIGALTIAGFYYICMNRSSGAIEGLYYDPNTVEPQKLDLLPFTTGHGISFGQVTYS